MSRRQLPTRDDPSKVQDMGHFENGNSMFMAAASQKNSILMLVAVAFLVLLQVLRSASAPLYGFLSYEVTTSTATTTASWKTKQEDFKTRQKKLLGSTFHPNISYPLPPLDSLLRVIDPASTTNTTLEPKEIPKQIFGDVQFLLDFAIVGFGKCGSTSILNWFKAADSSLVRALGNEPQWLTADRPDKMVNFLHVAYATQQEQCIKEGTFDPSLPTLQQRLFKGMKNPTMVHRPPTRSYIRKYWGKTPLIISLRHPVHWMVSLYNYWIIEKSGFREPKLSARDIIAPHLGSSPTAPHRDARGILKHFVTTSVGQFHVILAELGKTALQDDTEWKLLQPWMDRNHNYNFYNATPPNPIILLEMRQLIAKNNNTKQVQHLAHDLEDFVGLPRDYLPIVVPKVRPHAKYVNMTQEQADALKMDICAPHWSELLEELMSIARSASKWIRDHFIHSDDVFVSSPEYFVELLEDWNNNPCDATNQLREAAKTTLV